MQDGAASPGEPPPSLAPDAAGVPPTPPPPPIDAAPSAPPPAPTPPPGPFVPGPSQKSIAVYDENTVVDLQLTFPPGEWPKLLVPVGPGDLRWVRCSITFKGETFPTAACRRKGNAIDWPLEGKPQMLVRFNFFDKQARFQGLRRFNLEHFDGAEAPIRDRLGMWLMRQAGIDAPRVNHARVFVDGQLFGVYQNIEAIDKEFLEDHFGPEGEGNLWESADELKTNEAVNNQSELVAWDQLIAAEPLEGDHTAFWAKLDQMMDIDQVLREMAAETALLSDDNFSNGSSNFYLYDHPRLGFQILPWDLDTILTSVPANSDPFAFWNTSPPNKLRLLMNQNPAWKARFVDQVVEIRDQILVRMPAEVDRICNQIREPIRLDPKRTATFQDFEADCQNVKSGVAARIAALKTLLGR